MQRESWPTDALVKIDVEGAEYRLVPRLRPFLASRPTIIVSVHAYDLRASLARWPSLVRRAVHHARHAARTIPLLWAIRRYELVASDNDQPHWHRVSRRALVLHMSERELLLERT